jgi:hypothetical protein
MLLSLSDAGLMNWINALPEVKKQYGPHGLMLLPALIERDDGTYIKKLIVAKAGSVPRKLDFPEK